MIVIARRALVLVLAGMLAALLACTCTALAAPPPLGGLVQLSPPSACFETVAAGSCSASGAMNPIVDAEGVAISPDGADVYLANNNGSTIGVYSRNLNTGALTSLAGAGGLGQFSDVAVSPDGLNVYATTRNGGDQNGGLTAWLRNPSTGELGFVNCEAEQAPGSDCTNGPAEETGLNEAQSLAVSPDGKTVYVAASAGGGGSAGALTVHSRESVSGGVQEFQCLPSATTAAGVCHNEGAAVPQAQRAGAVAVSPDGNNVYLASGYGGGAVTSFNRINSGVATGAISPSSPVVNCVSMSAAPGCTAEAKALGGVTFGIAVSPDGRDVYVSALDGGVSVYERDPSTGALTFDQCLTGVSTPGCTLVPALNANDARQVAVSPDGRFVYVTVTGALGEGGVIAFARNLETGALSEINCISMLGASGCVAGSGLTNAEGVAVSPSDGRNVYVAAYEGSFGGQGALAAFSAQLAPVCQSATVSVAAGATVTLPLACADPDGDSLMRAIVGAPAHGTLGAIEQSTGTVTYTAAAGFTGADALTFTGSDGTNSSTPATVSITVTSAPSGGTSLATKGSPLSVLPHSRITGLHAKMRASKLKGFTGNANGPFPIAKVEIALEWLAGGAVVASKKARPVCLELSSRGRLTKVKAKGRSCPALRFLLAKGTSTWTFHLRHRLPPGIYVLTSRATDVRGQRESSFSAALGNQVRFTVR
jgi:DNA-binding beta-propeller fold protein YncE